MLERLVVVTRRTRLEELVRRFNSRSQARFYIEHAGGDFQDYESEDDAYRSALERMHRELDFGQRTQWLDRALLPNFLFDAQDCVVTIGQDGLVANAAKYVGSQPLVAVNPDPERFDGVLLPFSLDQARPAVGRTLEGLSAVREVTLAEAALGDGQRLRAFNDIFIGPRSHTSARYLVRFGGREEPQSSSGIIISTGAGSTGWLSSLFNMTAGLAQFAGLEAPGQPRMNWEDPSLFFIVREPFASRHSRCSIVAGRIDPSEMLEIESRMPTDGVIFSDGIESDFLHFHSGVTARIGAAADRARLVVHEDSIR